jgi:hypothetical protein
MYQRTMSCRYPLPVGPSDGGDSGPTNIRMSTTSNAASTPVVRRTMPSGSVNSGEPAGGVVHPSTQVADGAPRVRGGRSGSAGGVGDANVTGAPSDGLVGASERDGVDPAEITRSPAGPAAGSPSHAVSRQAATSQASASGGSRRMNITIP